ncbi:MAG: ATP-binding protein [Kiritimatiellae bacterium]|nr:ATP-binding protein [Kiritimatiellia bacterium]
MANPFNYLQFATGDQFYDRREVRKDLLSRFLSGQTNVVLYGPRRYGKSSLVAELVGDLEKAGIPCVTLDVVKVPSIDMFVSAYATKVYRRLAPVKFEFRKLGMFLKSLRPKMSLGPTGETGLSFEPSGATVGPEALTEVLDLPQKLLSGKGRAVVVFDEFQEVKDLLPNDGFERVMRSAIQSHRNVSYIFLGSRYHMLRRMFTDHNRPFYKSAVTILLGKPPVEESVRFVIDRFASAGKSIARDAAERLVGKIENIPYFIQQLGFETFRLADDAHRKSVSSADVDSAFANLSCFNRDQYEQLMLTLSVSQKKLLIALAHEQTDEFGDVYRRRYALGVSSTVNSAKSKLMEDGHIELSDGKYVVADPFFAQFLRT